MTTSINQLYDIFLEHPFVTTDSRNVPQGGIFFALKGEKFDGNNYAPVAIENGAAYAVIDNKSLAATPNFLLVNDVLSTLQQLAQLHRLHFSVPIIAITGSNGKTTTKELTGAVLSKQFSTLVTQGNLNNHIGVPLTILSITSKTEIAVVEMGANHKGEIAMLCRIASPTYGLITNIGKAHLEGFGSFDGVVSAKTELYDHLRNVQGKIFLNADDSLLNSLSNKIDRIKYGTGENLKVKGKLTGEFPFIKVNIETNTGRTDIETQLTGSYNIHNILAAACIGDHFGVDLNNIREAIAGYKPTNNRSQLINTRQNKIIMDAYNANPSSMEAAISHFAKFPGQNKVIILGDMLELGAESLAEHNRILDLALHSGAGEIILIGRWFGETGKNKVLNTFSSVEEAIQRFRQKHLSGKTILIKGSRGIRLEKLLDVL
ncbi:MAG TPA: UDP-N-acetylmuramoyl-tripeptide--D-alanyl-D-alanine ligase [Bacteroidales bacterium]|nr:UDP-N-acetylmuramoyl-tripeptide--D-alanyl-D-alanine ligase [Bacteroidales bacterium]